MMIWNNVRVICNCIVKWYFHSCFSKRWNMPLWKRKSFLVAFKYLMKTLFFRLKVSRSDNNRIYFNALCLMYWIVYFLHCIVFIGHITFNAVGHYFHISYYCKNNLSGYTNIQTDWNFYSTNMFPQWMW